MALGIPLPGSFGDALSKGLATGSDVMQRMVMNPYDMAAKQAAAQKDQAEAQKSAMLANMINNMFGNGSGGGGGETGGIGGDANKRATAGWLLGLGEFPGDKRAGETQQTADTERIKTNEKMRTDVLDSAYVLKNSYKQLQRVKEILNRRPDVTGLVQGTLANRHLSTDPDLAALIAASGKMQANQARSATARPGIGAINWAQKIKSNEYDPSTFNTGKLNEMEDDFREEYDTYRRQYKEATGLNMPTFEEFMETQPQQGGQTGNMGVPMGTPSDTTSEAIPQNTAGSGAPRLANEITLPRFNSKEEFQAWYKKQPAITQHAIMLKLQSGK